MSCQNDSPTKILWVHDDFEGPMNGLIEYAGEKLWFSRIKLCSPGRYILTKLSDELLSSIEKNHVKYCEETGAPLNHGDPIKIKRKSLVSKMDYSGTIPTDGADTSARILTTCKIYNHNYDPQNIPGDYVTTITENDIINFNVPRTIFFN